MNAKRSPLVLITGANGSLGSILRRRFAESGWEVRSLVRSPSPANTEDTVIGSVTDKKAMDAACQDVDSIIHMGGVSIPGHAWDEYLTNNIDGTRTVLEAAMRSGVRRVSLASSNHAVGYTRRSDGVVPAETPARPDSLYGVSKAAVEALGSFYADEYGLETTSLRIGSCFPRPTTRRMLSTWLSEGDLYRLVEASLTGPWSGHRTVWGISRNTRRWWSLEEGEKMGYFPVDDAETYASEVPDNEHWDPSEDYVGGGVPPQRTNQENS